MHLLRDVEVEVCVSMRYIALTISTFPIELRKLLKHKRGTELRCALAHLFSSSVETLIIFACIKDIIIKKGFCAC